MVSLSRKRGKPLWVCLDLLREWCGFPYLGLEVSQATWRQPSAMELYKNNCDQLGDRTEVKIYQRDIFLLHMSELHNQFALKYPICEFLQEWWFWHHLNGISLCLKKEWKMTESSGVILAYNLALTNVRGEFVSIDYCLNSKAKVFELLEMSRKARAVEDCAN